MKEYKIETPISVEDLAEIRVGDRIYLTGIVVTARDLAHRRIVVENLKPPIDLNGLALFHAGPIVRKLKDGKWKIVSIGSTTSMRMEQYEDEFIHKTGVKLIIGKGFMGEKTAKACKRYGAIVTLYPGGCAALASKSIREVLGVYWLDLGIPEALWVIRVEDFGPLTATIDARGENLLNQRIREIESSRSSVTKTLRQEIRRIMRPAGFEPATTGSGGQRPTRLDDGRSP